MKVDYSPEAITRRIVMASELGRLCRSLRSRGSAHSPRTRTQPHLQRGLSVVQWQEIESNKTESSSTPQKTDASDEVHAHR